MKKLFIIILFFTGAMLAEAQSGDNDTINIFQVDTVLQCNTDSLYVTVEGVYDSIVWNTYETTSGIWVFETGTYSVTVFEGPGSECDTVYINLILARILQNDTSICYGDTIILSVERKRSECLVAYYPFDGDSKDYGGNGFDAFPFGAVLAADRFGNPRSAYSFNGQNSFMLATIDSIASTFAISLWFRTPDTLNWYPKNAYPTLFDYNNGRVRGIIHGKQTEFINSNTVGKLRIAHFAGAGSPENFHFDTDNKPSFEEWHHYYAVYNKDDNNHEIWVDGQLEGQYFYEAPLTLSQKLMFFGRSDSIHSDSSYFVGRLDDISVYNCSFDSSHIQALYRSGSIFEYDYYWSTDDTLPAISVSPTDTTSYYVTVSDGINSCSDSIVVSVNPEIVLTLTQIDIGCPGEDKAKMLAVVSGGTSPYVIEWDERIRFLQGDTLALGLTDSIEYEIVVVDSVMCMIEDDFEVEAKALPEIEFTWIPEEVYIQNPVVEFLGESDSASTWFWDFGDGATDIVQNPTHTFSAVELFTVMLQVVAENGCVDSLFKDVDVKEVELIIPNVFTPNGDGINDTFVIVDLDKYITNTLVVFNRWGKSVYEKNGYISGEWDGRNLSDATYFYILRCTGYFSVDEFKGTINIFGGSN